jgi:biopolymer transport protein ExbB
MGWAMAIVARANESADSKASAGFIEMMSPREIFDLGGWLMYPLAGMSFLVLALIVYFLFVIRQGAVLPRRLADEVKFLVSHGRMEEARVACEKKACAFSSVLLAGLNYVKQSGSKDPSLIKEVMEGEGGRQAGSVMNQTQYLLDLGVIAPMIGLLGTVVGMLKAFNTVALDLAKAKPMLLASGVSQALITTVAGLVVAIPAMLAYAYFRGRAQKIISRLESSCAELLGYMGGGSSS